MKDAAQGGLLLLQRISLTMEKSMSVTAILPSRKMSLHVGRGLISIFASFRSSYHVTFPLASYLDVTCKLLCRRPCPARTPLCTLIPGWQPTPAGPCCLPAHTQPSQTALTKTLGHPAARVRSSPHLKAGRQRDMPGCRLLPHKRGQVSSHSESKIIV